MQNVNEQTRKGDNMRVAIVGSGFIANVHAEAITELKHSISIIVDNDQTRAKSFADKWEIESFSTDFNDVLRHDIDVVHICTPPTLHYEMVKKALLAGKNVVCEKPLCLDPAQAKELMEIAKDNNLVGAVNFNVRFHDACKKIKESISKEDFGRVCLIHGSYMQEFHALPADYMWRYDTEVAGKMRATTEIGSHWIDLARYLTGLEIKEVSANYGNFTPDRYISDGVMYEEFKEDGKKITVTSDDAAIVSLRFSNGAIGHMLLSEVSHGRNNLVSIEVSGTKKSVWWNTENPYSVNTSKKFEGINTSINAFGGGFPNTFKSFFTEVYKDIESNIKSSSPAYPNFYDGYINSAVCEAIFKSANNNSIWVEV